MFRWLLLGMALLGFALVFSTRSALVLAVGVVLAAAGLFGFVLALAADRIAANARPETSMASREDLIALNSRAPRAGTVRRAPSAAGSNDASAARQTSRISR